MSTLTTDLAVLAAIVLVGGGVAGYEILSKKKTQDELTAPRNGNPTPSTDTHNAANWDIGPHVFQDGTVVDKSPGMPDHPSQGPDGPYFEFPIAPNSVHYQTTNIGNLTGKTKLVGKVRVAGPDGFKLAPVTGDPGNPPLFTPGFIQRNGDPWTGADQFKLYRWYATAATVGLHGAFGPGDYPFEVPLDIDHWTPEDVIPWTSDIIPAGRTDLLGKNVDTSTPEGRAYLQKWFDEALADTEIVGMVLGGGDGLGHGMAANVPGGTLTVLEYGFQ